jgi:predicted  nucleic acid-binding Zn-ribbon protein
VLTAEDAEKQRKLESEVTNLRSQLNSMSDTLVGLKEELKQREDSLQTQREAYEKLTEEFCILHRFFNILFFLSFFFFYTYFLI